MKKTALFIIIALLFAPSSMSAETIYTWKGKDGVMKFSDSPPPEDVTDYKTITSSDTETNDPVSESQRRSSYDQMVQQASKEANASNAQRKQKAEAKAAERQRSAEKQKKERLQSERKQLERQIEAIEKRAVSRTYPNGMKQAQIDALRKKIKELKLDPAPWDAWRITEHTQSESDDGETRNKTGATA